MPIRQIGFAILAAVAAVVVVTMRPADPEPVDTSRFDRQVQQALSDFETNEARTQGAPQQQVVNGWVNRDLLTIISRQLSTSMETVAINPPDERVPVLLLILVLTAGWHGATTPRPSQMNSKAPAGDWQPIQSSGDSASSSESNRATEPGTSVNGNGD